MKDKVTYIPFGTRCSAATVLKEYLHKREASLPFDWIDISMKALINFIPESRGNIRNHVYHYLGEIVDQKHPYDETWFVHDFPKGRHATEKEFQQICDKYIRRFNRLFDNLNSGYKIVMLTVIAHVNDDNLIPYEVAADKIGEMCRGPFYPVVINLSEHDTNFDVINLSVLFEDDWTKFHRDIAAKLTTHEFTKHLF